MKLFPQRHIHPIETVPFNGTKRLPRMATTCRGLKFATNPDSPALMLPPLQHVAAVVALMLQFNGGNRSLMPAQICSTLTNAAIDVDDPTTVGFDVGFRFRYGIGSYQCFRHPQCSRTFAFRAASPSFGANTRSQSASSRTQSEKVPVATPKASIPALNAAALSAPAPRSLRPMRQPPMFQSHSLF
jgi:hypothetical protein